MMSSTMDISPELAVAITIAALVFLAGMLMFRSRRSQTRTVTKLASTGGPTDLRFTCAACSQRFTHSRRTMRAWKSGERSFYCNACLTKSQLTKEVSPSVSGRPSASTKHLRQKNARKKR